MNAVSQATFVFADIAGFTALTEAHGDEHAADLVAQFCDTVNGVLPDYDAEPIKSIGDATLIRVPHAAPAIRLGTRIAHELMDRTRRAVSASRTVQDTGRAEQQGPGADRGGPGRRAVRGADPRDDRAVGLALDSDAAGDAEDVRRGHVVQGRVGVHAQHPVVGHVGALLRADEHDLGPSGRRDRTP